MGKNKRSVMPQEGKNKRSVMPQEGKAIVHRGEIRSYSYSGILPPPEMLNQYNMIEPWLADRIVKMAENQQGHRFGMEDFGIREMYKRDKRIQYISWFLLLVILIWAFVLLFLWRNIQWFLILVGTMITSIGAWWYSTARADTKKIEKKQEED